ncbi:uncharacterized protein TNCV_5066161 [Trichonephila clavipes]|nr:uncharacterized protein TNCV_5066161 [Trichonephila clavipes]
MTSIQEPNHVKAREELINNIYSALQSASWEFFPYSGNKRTQLPSGSVSHFHTTGLGSIPGLGKVDSAFHPFCTSGNRYSDAQYYFCKQKNIHQCTKKIRALQTVSEAKREEFVDNALIYAKSLCEELEISFGPPRRIRRKHIFGDGSKDVQLSYEVDLRRTMFSSIDRVTAEIRERFQQLQTLA